MKPTKELPSEIQNLLNAAEIRRVDEDEFVIDALRHRERTWMGWNIVVYTLRIEEDDAGQSLFEIIEQTESLGEDVVVSSTDPDEVAYWITDQIVEKNRL
jgi:hypothetical protein